MADQKISDLGLFSMRLVLGIIFIVHGAQKLFAVFGGPGIEQFADGVAKMGFAPPLAWAYAAALSEFVGGAFLLLGILPRLSAASIASVMLVAILKVHGPSGLLAANGGFEYPLLILAVTLSFILTGSGKFSIFNKF